jgi:hypothetical protein
MLRQCIMFFHQCVLCFMFETAYRTYVKFGTSGYALNIETLLGYSTV